LLSSTAAFLGLLTTAGFASDATNAAQVRPQISSVATTLAERVTAAYASVETFSAEVRKTTETGGRSVRLLTRFFARRPDRVHVDNVSPMHRRIVADGTRLYYFEKGAKRGFSRPIAELDADWLVQLRSLPGTPLEHTVRLLGLAETELPPSREHPIRRGYATPKVFVVLCASRDERVERIEFYTRADLKERTGRCEYRDFVRHVGVWFARVERTSLERKGDPVSETRLVESIAVNGPVADSLFKPDAFFDNVEFVSEIDHP
jgi:hypothetical protein